MEFRPMSDLRVNSKPGHKAEGDETSTFLNVEKKRTKDRSSYEGRLNNDNLDRDRDNLTRRGPCGSVPNRNSTAGNGGAGTPPGGPYRLYNYNESGPSNHGSYTYNNRRLPTRTTIFSQIPFA
ncbi:hypothetical protein HHI36_004884 [Cryptolaemus montrouzieri]|uniref:Uncharacterized protein n=1 Tax=Cryptolaemus montrouzieri TaxID=559131 RepID=A0ABD2NSY4_9CUCU